MQSTKGKMMIMGKLGAWDEEAFRKALQQFDPEMRIIVERVMREDRELLLRLAKS